MREPTTPFFDVRYLPNTTNFSVGHLHNYYEMVYFFSGNRTYFIDGKCFSARNNTIILIPPFTPHSTKGSSEVDRIVVYFDEAFLQQYFSPNVIQEIIACFSANFFDLTSVKSTHRLLANQIKRDFEGGDITLTIMHVAEFLLSIKSLHIKSQEEKEPQSNHPIALDAIAYIHKNILTVDSVQEIAQNVNMSPSRLATIFKATTGVSIMQYVINAKINLAARALATTKKHITDIAMECGFSSNAHFSNTFKKFFDVSPSEYRAKMQQTKTEEQ